MRKAFFSKQLRKLSHRVQRNFKEFAYIHIPKTGGTYLAQLEGNRRSVLSSLLYLGHTYIVTQEGIPNPLYFPRDPENSAYVDRLEDIRHFKVVSTVRNPFSWLVSYAAHAGGWTPSYRDEEHYDYEVANKGFDYLVRTIADREETWPNRKFIFCQLFCNNGEMVVDWFNRTESLDDDLTELASQAGKQFQRRDKQRVGAHEDYRKYYTDALIDLVNKTWGRELRLLGYRFDGTEDTSEGLYRVVEPDRKSRIRYFWDDDRLTIDDNEVVRDQRE